MTLSLRYARLDTSTVDGPGVRTVLWFQGCSIQCAGCQNRDLWYRWDGECLDPASLAGIMVDHNSARANESHLYTITGGEPFDQPAELQQLLLAIRILDPSAHIIVYTGYEWDRLVAMCYRGYRDRRLTIALIDVLVDGPYKFELDNDHMQYRGSANQRAIRVPATLAKKQVFNEEYSEQDLELVDWSSNGLFTIKDGAITAAIGWIRDAELNRAGTPLPAPRCGNIKERGSNGNGDNETGSAGNPALTT